jgi:hypothetical protein
MQNVNLDNQFLKEKAFERRALSDQNRCFKLQANYQFEVLHARKYRIFSNIYKHLKQLMNSCFVEN